jgi:hypothetical protein
MGNKGWPGHGIGRAGPAKASRICPGRTLCTWLSAGRSAQNPQREGASRCSGFAWFQRIQDEHNERLPSRYARQRAQTGLPALRRWPTPPMVRSARNTGGPETCDSHSLPASSSPPNFEYGIMITHRPRSRPGGTKGCAGATWRSCGMGVGSHPWFSCEVHRAASCGAGVLPVGIE